MRESVSVDSFIGSLPPIYTHDHIVRMANGKAYRVTRCGSDAAVYAHMRRHGFDTKEIVRVDLVAPKRG